MSEDRIEHLINKLRLLKVQEAHLLTQIEEENRRRESEVAIARNVVEVTEENNIQRHHHEISVGDRIWIKNKLKKPATWTSNKPWIEIEGRTATVTGFATGQVHFLTDNGVKTWRAPNNVEKIDKNTDE